MSDVEPPADPPPDPLPEAAPQAPDGTLPRKSFLPFAFWWPLVCGALVGVAARVVFSGEPGEPYAAMTSSFLLLVPLLVGAVTVYVAELSARRTAAYYFWAPFLANLLFVTGTLAILVEGLICAIVILPLFALFGGFGGLLMGAVCRATNWPKQTLLGLVALPLAFGAVEPGMPLPERLRIEERAIVVAAPPQRVWQALVDTRDIEPGEVGDAWMYRIGVPLPTAAIGARTAEGPVRHVTMGRGVHFDQVATVWEPGRHVRWAYRFAPDSFPAGALDDHVKIGGHYFGLGDTDYRLSPLPGGGTELRVTMRHRVSTQFNWYAGPLADALIGNFEDVILRFYARRAEAAEAASVAAGCTSVTAPATPAACPSPPRTHPPA